MMGKMSKKVVCIGCGSQARLWEDEGLVCVNPYCSIIGTDNKRFVLREINEK